MGQRILPRRIDCILKPLFALMAAFFLSIFHDPPSSGHHVFRNLRSPCHYSPLSGWNVAPTRASTSLEPNENQNYLGFSVVPVNNQIHQEYIFYVQRLHFQWSHSACHSRKREEKSKTKKQTITYNTLSSVPSPCLWNSDNRTTGVSHALPSTHRESLGGESWGVKQL